MTWFLVHMLHWATTENRASLDCPRYRAENQQWDCFGCKQGRSLRSGLGNQMAVKHQIQWDTLSLTAAYASTSAAGILYFFSCSQRATELDNLGLWLIFLLWSFRWCVHCIQCIVDDFFLQAFTFSTNKAEGLKSYYFLSSLDLVHCIVS